MKSTPPELSNDRSHNANNKLLQKLLSIYDFPVTNLIWNISEIVDATTYFLDPTFKEQSVDVYCQ